MIFEIIVKTTSELCAIKIPKIIPVIAEPENLMYIQENSTYRIYAEIPARIFPKEVAVITLFGIISPLAASWAASKNVLKMTVSEVLRYE